ncbi:MAG: hypothetical protein MJ145_01895 [Clostridia bacterium]|nr:hypothetical protein [Clostridia bacterium]
MKSTYKLFGVVRDGIEDSKQMLAADCVQQDTTSVVSLKDLLCASSEKDVAKVLEPIYDSDAIAINMDYHYDGKNPVTKTLQADTQSECLLFYSTKKGCLAP